MNNNRKTSLWAMLTTVKINPETGKCTTLPILTLNNQFSRNFHLYASSSPRVCNKLSFIIPRSWLGFWVALYVGYIEIDILTVIVVTAYPGLPFPH